LWFFGDRISFSAEALKEWLEQIPLVYRGIVYVILYVVITFFLFFSKDIFWIVGALYFGAAFSTILVSAAEVFNCCILFYLSRTLGRAFVKKRISSGYEHLDERLGTIGFFWLSVFRAAPVIPYRFLDMAVGLTGIPFVRYLLAVIIGTPVKTFFIQYVLAELGFSVFKDPAAMVTFMAGHPAVLWAGAGYLALMAAAVIKIGLTAHRRLGSSKG
jgi:uncharacterized membrane protein YdjX (TVP38/TMEM64 family)